MINRSPSLSTVDFSDGGYLLNPLNWNPSLANQLAHREQIELTELHWSILNFVRDYYLQHQTMPKMRELIMYLRDNPNYTGINSASIHKLFPYGPALQIAKIAGLPKPARCL